MDSFIIGRILRKLVRGKNSRIHDSSINLELSRDGVEQAEIYYRSNKKPTTLPPGDPLKRGTEGTAIFLQYQQELEASKLLQMEQKPTPPSKILKLPRKRK